MIRNKASSTRRLAAAGAALAIVLFGIVAWTTASSPLAFDRPILLVLRNAADTALPVGPAWAGSVFRAATMLASSATSALAVSEDVTATQRLAAKMACSRFCPWGVSA